MGYRVRFTTGKVKQAIFNIMGKDIIGSDFLELFAGSGAIGKEALKRGAKSTTFVDNDISRLKVLPRAQSPEPRISALQLDVFYAIRQFAGQKKRFDIIFLDPPYLMGLAKKTLNIIAKYDILTKIGIVIVEHHKKDILPETIQGLELFKKKQYGDSFVSFYKLPQISTD